MHSMGAAALPLCHFLIRYQPLCLIRSIYRITYIVYRLPMKHIEIIFRQVLTTFPYTLPSAAQIPATTATGIRTRVRIKSRPAFGMSGILFDLVPGFTPPKHYSDLDF